MKRSGLPRRTKPLKAGKPPKRTTALKQGAPPKRKTPLKAKTQTLNIRANLKPGKALAARKPIAARSKTSAKGRAAEGRAAFVKKMIERARGQCEMGTAIWEAGHRDHRCQRAASEVHEPLTRARGGRTDDPLNALATCRACHDWAHDNPSLSTPIGLLRNSWERENGRSPRDADGDERAAP